MWKAAKFLKRHSLLIASRRSHIWRKGGNKTYLSVELQWIPGEGSPLFIFSFHPFPGSSTPPHPHPLISKAVSVERGMQHIGKLERDSNERRLIFTCQQAFDLKPTEFLIVSQGKKKKKKTAKVFQFQYSWKPLKVIEVWECTSLHPSLPFNLVERSRSFSFSYFTVTVFV